jgi:hypothetical protein
MSLTGTAASGDEKNHRHTGRIDLLLVGNADGPSQAALA